MQLEPWQYADHHLMVRVYQNSERSYTFLADHCTQADIVSHSQKCFVGRPAGFDVMILDEESYELLEPSYRKQGPAFILET